MVGTMQLSPSLGTISHTKLILLIVSFMCSFCGHTIHVSPITAEDQHREQRPAVFPAVFPRAFSKSYAPILARIS